MSRFLVPLSIAILALVCLQFVAATTTAADRTFLLNYHNSARARMPALRMPSMAWDSDLETVAQAYADKCVYGHNGNRTADYLATGGTTFTSVGENIAAAGSSGSLPSVNYTSSGWWGEEAFWTYPTTCATGKVCGHWTQIIWENSTYVGCGVASCPRILGGLQYGLYVVCDYGPAGNYVGRAPFSLDRSAPAAQTPEFIPAAPNAASHATYSLGLVFVVAAALLCSIGL